MKTNKNHYELDEMLEQRLLKTEKRTMYIALFALLIVTVLQVIFTLSLKQILGELIVLFTMIGYILYANIKNGIWSKSHIPTTKMNALISLVPTIVVLLMTIIITIINYNNLKPLFTIVLFSLTAVVYFVTFVLLEVMRKLYNKKRTKLDNNIEDMK